MSTHREIFQDNPTACEECDWVNSIPPMPEGTHINCARCGHELYRHHPYLKQQLWFNSLVGFLLFGLSLTHNFLGFEAQGISRDISLLTCVNMLFQGHFQSLGILVSLALIVFPLTYIATVIFLLLMMSPHRRLPSWLYGMVHLLERLKPWLMVDVFLLGGLVALVKLHSLAHVSLGPSFWTFCCFTIVLLRLVSLVEKRWFWRQLAGWSPKVTLSPSIISEATPSSEQKTTPLDTISDKTATHHHLIGCDHCGALTPALSQAQGRNKPHTCVRCHHVLHRRKRHSLSTTCALLCTASILYIPANLYPIMSTTFLGQSEPSTIVGGILLLWGMQSYPVALVILIASVLVPIAKILSLFWLCWHTRFPQQMSAKKKQKIYHLTELVGKWSMVDVFVVAILVALVQLGQFMAIQPGPAALSFSGVVICTMLAAFSFDPRLMWDRQENHSCHT